MNFKNKLLALIATTSCALSFAQQNMYIWTTDGNIKTYNIENVDSVTFSKPIVSLSVKGENEQTVNQYTPITDIVYSWNYADSASVTGLPKGVTAKIDKAKRTLTLTGSPTETGEFNYEVITVSNFQNATINGTITVKPGSATLDLTAQQLASKMYLACNIGNTFEAVGCSTTESNETCWGSPVITKQIIDAYKAAGFNTVRLPVAWNIYAEENGGIIPDWWMERIQTIVDYCMEDGLYVLLNIHWDGGWLESHVDADSKDEVNKKQESLWKQIATHFMNYDEHLVFCSANEPAVDDEAQASILKSYHQTFVNTVRATGGFNGTRCLVIQGPSTAADKTAKYDFMPTDVVSDRLMAEFHYYPYTYALMEEDASWSPAHWFWGKDYQNIIVDGVNRSCSWHTEETVISEFSALKDKFVSKGIPVVMGEFAIMNRELSSEWQSKFEECRANYYRFLTKTAKENGIVPVLWDTPNGSKSVIDRDKCSVGNKTAMDGLLKGAEQGKYPY